MLKRLNFDKRDDIVSLMHVIDFYLLLDRIPIPLFLDLILYSILSEHKAVESSVACHV